ncbi:hypothetical protein HQ560_10135 [bacterium]|nr:hypothetical protein [bacterium]
MRLMGWMAVWLASVASAGEVSVTLGERRVILKSGQLGLKYFPDGAVSVLEGAPEAPFRMIVPAGVHTYLVEGKSLTTLTKAVKVLSPGGKGEFDNGYAGISSAYHHSDGRWYGFYHAEDQEGMPPIPGGIPGFYCCVAVAVSEDGGESWRKLAPCLTSSKPKAWTAFPKQTDRGLGEACTAVSREGAHLYAYYTEHSRVDGRGVQICMARAPIADKAAPPGPGAWFKYHKGGFAQPGLGGLDTPVLSAAGMDGADAAFPHVSYSKALDRYVMVFNINVWKEFVENRGLQRSGIYVTYADDGIHWSEPKLLIRDYAVARTGQSVSWHPAVVWDDAARQAGWLVYSHSPNWGHAHQGRTPHHMVARRITFDGM